jgi:hypothetical protein
MYNALFTKEEAEEYAAYLRKTQGEMAGIEYQYQVLELTTQNGIDALKRANLRS